MDATDLDNGWWVDAHDKQYNECVYGVQFKDGMGFVPGTYENMEAIIQHLLEDLCFSISGTHSQKG
jgi:hypothetical protein